MAKRQVISKAERKLRRLDIASTGPSLRPYDVAFWISIALIVAGLVGISVSMVLRAY